MARNCKDSAHDALATECSCRICQLSRVVADLSARMVRVERAVIEQAALRRPVEASRR